MHPERIHQVLRVYALRCLAKLIEEGSPPAACAEAAAGGGWNVTISVTPAAAGAECLSGCEKDVLSVLADAPGRLTTGGVVAALERRSLLHGYSTVKKALAHLTHLKLIEAKRRNPRGYVLVNGSSQ